MRRVYWAAPLLVFLQSCVYSRVPVAELGTLNKGDLAQVRSIRPPVFLAKPIVRLAMGNDPPLSEIWPLVRKVRAAKVTVAQTVSGFDRNKLAALPAGGLQNWATVRSDSMTVYVNAVQEGETVRKMSMLLSSAGNRLVYCKVRCKISADDLSKLISMALANGWKNRPIETGKNFARPAGTNLK